MNGRIELEPPETPAARKRRKGLPAPPIRPAAARRRARGDAPAYRVAMDVIRGKCRAKGCGSRFALIRVTTDFAASRERAPSVATAECVNCGRVWYGMSMPAKLTHRDGALRVRLTLIVPSGEDVALYRLHGVWHREGDDTDVVADASLVAYMEARDAWRKRNAQLSAARFRAAERKAAADAAREAHTREVLARMAARDAERAAEEAAAAAREAAYA